MNDLNRLDQQIGLALRGLPDFVLPLAIVLATMLGALVLHWLAYRALARLLGHSVSDAAALVRRSRRPMRIAFVLAGLTFILPQVRLPYGWEDTLQHIALILLVVLLGWTAILLTNHFAARAVRRYRLDTDDNLSARKYVTQVRVLRRAAVIVLGLLSAGAVLVTFESVQRYGLSLFASAGAAGLVLGFAARPVLANLIAGIQIAITQPIRLDDVVIVEGEWGWIEEIFATYVVVRIWDWRRMVVPLSYFIEQPFENWTRESASIIGAVNWHLDYTVPIGAAREKLMALIADSPHWDGQVANMQVTDTDKDTITLRALMSARTSPRAWDLRCEVREKFIEWIQAEHPGALPRLRGDLVTRPAPGGPRAVPGTQEEA